MTEKMFYNVNSRSSRQRQLQGEVKNPPSLPSENQRMSDIWEIVVLNKIVGEMFNLQKVKPYIKWSCLMSFTLWIFVKFAFLKVYHFS